MPRQVFFWLSFSKKKTNILEADVLKYKYIFRDYNLIFLAPDKRRLIVITILQSPFSYPHFVHVFDISGKRNVDIRDLIDRYINETGFEPIESHDEN